MPARRSFLPTASFRRASRRFRRRWPTESVPTPSFAAPVSCRGTPTRREMLIATRFADTAQLHRVAAAGGARTQLTFFPDRVVSAAYPGVPPRGQPFFVFQKDSGGNEFSQNYRFDVEGGAVTLLTDGRSRNSLGVFARRDARLAYTSTRRTGADTDLYVVDPGSRRAIGWSPRSRAAVGRSSTGRRTAASCWCARRSPSTRATCGRRCGDRQTHAS